jgi:hypothetical protein
MSAIHVSLLAACLLALVTACGGEAAPTDTATGDDVATDSIDDDGLTSNDIEGPPADGIEPGGDVTLPDTGEDASDDIGTDPDDALTSIDIDAPTDIAAPEDGSVSADISSGDCPLGLSCVSGFCVAGVGDGQCVTDADCPGISTCNAEPAGGVCIGCGGDGDCPGTTECTTSGACAEPCTSQDDCLHGRCATTIGFCVIRTCNDSSACAASETCNEGQCQRIRCANPCAPNPCTDTGRSVCTATGGDFTCSCESGLEPDPDGPGCIAPTPGDCAPSFACRSELCVQTSASFFQCVVDGDCGGGLTCSPALPSGTCQGCTSPGQCPAGYDTCLAGRCLRSCTGAGDCHAGMTCTAQGFCGQKTCGSDTDCGAGYVCSPTGDPRRCVRAACTP